MMDQSKCYEILGVRPGVSPQELKAAHRDLAKVWHPDRFAHDPRLQAKAQEKLKEINEAFDQLISKGKRRPMPTPQASYKRRESRRSGATHLGYWPGMLIALLMFSLVFFFTLRSMRRNQQQAQSHVATTEQTTALEQSDTRADGERGELSKVKNRKEQSEEESIPQQTGENVTALQPMPTATVTIDPLTGKVARRECPTKRTMTYPKGNEPSIYCDVHKPLPPLQAERQPPDESRIKSVTKRVLSPDKW